MSFEARTRDEIRDAALAALRARYSAIGRAVDVSEGSDLYMRADALAVILATFSQQAAAQVRDTFIDTASAEAVAKHARMYAIEPRAAVACKLLVQVSGAAGARIGGAGLTLSRGPLSFAVADTIVALDETGAGFVTIVAATPGTANALDEGAELVWDNAPSTALDPIATVTSVVVAAEDAEDVESLRARVLARIRQRPASGNVEDWREWIENCDGVDAGFVYPLLEPPSVSGDKLGCVSLVVIGPPQGDSVANTRVIPSERLDSIRAYILGDADASGAPAIGGLPLLPASMSPDDLGVYGGGTSIVDVEIAVRTSERYPFPFSGPLTITGSPTATSIDVLGNHAAKTGSRVLVRVGSSLIRGAWQVATLHYGTYDGSTKTTFQVSLLGAPTLATIYPAARNWEAIRSAVLAVFDTIGPRDTTPPRRWPTVDTSHPDIVRTSALVSAALGVEGITHASVASPATDFAPTEAKQLATLGELLITEAP